jgi:putative endonuclease
MTNKSRTLYTGITNDLERRVYEHRHKMAEGFAKRYNITRLVYYELINNARDAIAREKQIKGWRRVKKVALIEELNPQWIDLSANWFKERDSSTASACGGFAQNDRFCLLF